MYRRLWKRRGLARSWHGCWSYIHYPVGRAQHAVHNGAEGRPSREFGSLLFTPPRLRVPCVLRAARSFLVGMGWVDQIHSPRPPTPHTPHRASSASPALSVGRRSYLGSQPDSSLRSAPDYGFGTDKIGSNPHRFVSSALATDALGQSSPGPKYRPSTAGDGRHPRSPAHAFGVSHRYSESQMKRIAVVAPGPLKTRMPPSVGRQPNSLKVSEPSYSFGLSPRDDESRRYLAVTEFTSNSATVGAVGQAQSSSQWRTCESYGMGTAERFFYDNVQSLAKAVPGPGTYELPVAHGPQLASDRPSKPRHSFPRSPRKGPDLSTASPGPKYTPRTAAVGRQISSPRTSEPSYRFARATRFPPSDTEKHDMPGPGAYRV